MKFQISLDSDKIHDCIKLFIKIIMNAFGKCGQCRYVFAKLVSIQPRASLPNVLKLEGPKWRHQGALDSTVSSLRSPFPGTMETHLDRRFSSGGERSRFVEFSRGSRNEGFQGDVRSLWKEVNWLHTCSH